jgi:hypothetical protein
MEPVSYSNPVSPEPASRGIFGTNIPSSVSSIVAFLLFFLPFAEIRCKDSTSEISNMFNSNTAMVASNSGVGLALGLSWKSSLDNLGQQMGVNRERNLGNREEPNYYALVAWVLALGAAVFSLIKWKWGPQLAMVSAVLSFSSMIALYIDLKGKVKDVGNGSNTGTAVDQFTDVQLEMSFTPWFFAVALLLLATAFFAYKRRER